MKANTPQHARRLSTILLTLVAAITIFAQEFNRVINVPGGAPRRVSSLLIDAGYTGPASLDFLTICNPTGATNTLYYGQTDVSPSNGNALLAGDCNTWPSGKQATNAGQIYLYTATSQNAEFTLRSTP